MTNHPITPPTELVQQWNKLPLSTEEILAIAWRHGADQELEACCEWIADWYGNGCDEVIGNLRSDRRPKPPSLKEQALKELQMAYDTSDISMVHLDTIRRALEQLND
jgi:hypothetical protein